MNQITVAQLRQNPTAMLDAVERGEEYQITRHNKVIGRIIPEPVRGVNLIPPKRAGSARLSQLPPLQLNSFNTIDELIEWNKGEW